MLAIGVALEGATAIRKSMDQRLLLQDEEHAVVNATSKNVPKALYAMMRNIMVRDCVLQHLSSFSKGKSAHDREVALFEAEFKTSAEVWKGGVMKAVLKSGGFGLEPADFDLPDDMPRMPRSINPNMRFKMNSSLKEYDEITGLSDAEKREANAALRNPKGLPSPFEGVAVEKDDGIDTEKFPSCAPGMPVLGCAAELPPSMWLQQMYVAEDRLEVHGRRWFCPGCTTSHMNFNEESVSLKRQFFAKAVDELDFNVDGATALCEAEGKQPDKMLVRQCILEKERRRITERKGGRRVSEALQTLLWQIWLAEDERVAKYHLGEWSWETHGTGLQHWLGRDKDAVKIAKLRSGAKALGYDESLRLQECKDQLEAMGEQSEQYLLERVVKETTGACQGDVENCDETPGAYCPEGTACDCARTSTPERGQKAFNMVFFVISPVTVALISGVAGYATGGASAIPGAIWSAGWFPDWIPAAIAMVAFSRNWFPECACIEKTCAAVEGVCKMVQTSPTMKASSNPFADLPLSGHKCATPVTPGSSKSACELRVCEDEDVLAQGDGLGNPYFGRVGRFGRDLLNCANTQRTRGSLVGVLPRLPGDQDNTPAARVEFYRKYFGPQRTWG